MIHVCCQGLSSSCDAVVTAAHLLDQLKALGQDCAVTMSLELGIDAFECMRLSCYLGIGGVVADSTVAAFVIGLRNACQEVVSGLAQQFVVGRPSTQLRWSTNSICGWESQSTWIFH